MKIQWVVCFLCLFLMSTHLSAEHYEYSGDCKFKGDMDALKHCLELELLVNDKELNRIYNDFIKRSHDISLKKSEVLWVKFKEADCDFIAGAVNEGLYYQVIQLACSINKTKSRIADLKQSFFISEWFP